MAEAEWWGYGRTHQADGPTECCGDHEYWKFPFGFKWTQMVFSGRFCYPEMDWQRGAIPHLASIHTGLRWRMCRNDRTWWWEILEDSALTGVT